MPVSGSTATASCMNRPISLSGNGSALRRLSKGSTSKIQPWSFVYPRTPARSSVSSHVSHVPQGVMPPEQLIAVPPRLTYSCWVRSEALSTSVVVPPAAPGSYVVASPAVGTLCGALGLASWLRTRCVRCARAKLPMPSCRLGTSPPPDLIGSPSRDRIR